MSDDDLTIDPTEIPYIGLEPCEMWGVLFWHPHGWTVSAVEHDRAVADRELARQIDMLPMFQYRIARVKIMEIP